MTDERYEQLKAKLEADFPGINDPTSERFYYARLSGNELRRIAQEDYARSQVKLAMMIAALAKGA